jgi:hypothetical protein
MFSRAEAPRLAEPDYPESDWSGLGVSLKLDDFEINRWLIATGVIIYLTGLEGEEWELENIEVQTDYPTTGNRNYLNLNSTDWLMSQIVEATKRQARLRSEDIIEKFKEQEAWS